MGVRLPGAGVGGVLTPSGIPSGTGEMLRCCLSLTLPMSPAQNRGRLADKRTVVLPPARSLKKELTPSDGDSDCSGPACGQLGLKQENSRVRIMKRRCVSRGPWRVQGLQRHQDGGLLTSTRGCAVLPWV